MNLPGEGRIRTVLDFVLTGGEHQIGLPEGESQPLRRVRCKAMYVQYVHRAGLRSVATPQATHLALSRELNRKGVSSFTKGLFYQVIEVVGHD